MALSFEESKRMVAASPAMTMEASIEDARPVVDCDEDVAIFSVEDQNFTRSGNYTWFDTFSDNDFSTVDTNKEITLSPTQVNITQENNSQVIPFEMPRYYDGVDLMSMTIQIHYVKISVAVRVSAKANNSITIEDDGLYVAVPDAYTKAETDAKIKKVQDQLDGHSKDAVVHITAEERKAWNAKVSQDELTAAKSEVISAAAADATKKADAARDTAKTYADGLNTAMDNRVKSVEGALTWKAIDDSGANAET